MDSRIRELREQLHPLTERAKTLRDAKAENERQKADLILKLDELRKRIAAGDIEIKRVEEEMDLIKQEKRQVGVRAGSPGPCRPPGPNTNDATSALGGTPVSNVVVDAMKEFEEWLATSASPQSKPGKQTMGSSEQKQQLKVLGNVPASPGPASSRSSRMSPRRRERSPARSDSPTRLAFRMAREKASLAKACLNNPRGVAKVGMVVKENPPPNDMNSMDAGSLRSPRDGHAGGPD